MEEEEFAFQSLLKSKLPTAMPEWASPDVRSSLTPPPRSTIITHQSIWRVDPSLGPADVVVAGGGADGVGFKALEEIQPGRSRGGTIGWGVCRLEHGDKMAVLLNTSTGKLRKFEKSDLPWPEWERGRYRIARKRRALTCAGAAAEPSAARNPATRFPQQSPYRNHPARCRPWSRRAASPENHRVGCHG